MTPLAIVALCYLGVGLFIFFASIPDAIQEVAGSGIYSPQVVATAAVLAMVVYPVLWPFFLRRAR